MRERISIIRTELEGYKNNLDLYKLLDMDESVISDTYTELEKVLGVIDKVLDIKYVDGTVRLFIDNNECYDISNNHIQDIVLSSADTEYDEMYEIIDIDSIRNGIIEDENDIEKLYYLAKDSKYLAFDSDKKSVIFINSDEIGEQHEVVNRVVYEICNKLKFNKNVLRQVKIDK